MTVAVSLLAAPLTAVTKAHSTKAHSTTTRSKATSTAAKRRVKQKSSHSSAARKTSKARTTTASLRSSRGRHRRPVHHKFTLAGMHLEPQRIEEIQSALAGAGYLHGQPTGQWDTSTRDAMRRYQTANGFSATGLPDAKSLMKLGLGPHPLPADVGAASPATASLDPATKPDSLPAPTPQP